MSVFKLLVQIHELRAAAKAMNQAAETYNDAVEACKSAAEDVASKWEGATRDAFVAHQENAYSWYTKMLAVVRQMISTIEKVITEYENNEAEGTNRIK